MCVCDLLTLTLVLLTWRIWRTPNNASRWQMGFNWAFKGLLHTCVFYFNTLRMIRVI